MSDYFINFPLITYNGSLARDITRRANFVDSSLADPFVFLPYTIKEGEKPEDIANFYYGDVAYTWLVMLANDRFDAFTDWPMDDDTLIQYMISKYAEQSGKTGFDVITWMQNKNLANHENVAYFYNTETMTKVSRETVTLATEPNINLTPVNFYDLEVQQNDNKREIVLIEARYKNQIEKEFKKLIKI